MRELRCQERGCLSRTASPQFTAPLSSIERSKSSRQPRWFCGAHATSHPSVSALDGSVKTNPVKSYTVRGGKLVPLGARDQYEVVRGGKNG